MLALFAVPWPPQGIFTNKEINQIADLKGLFWRAQNATTQRIAQIVEAKSHHDPGRRSTGAGTLATGLINALMTSGATGYDVRVWESMHYYYDTQAWISEECDLGELGRV